MILVVVDLFYLGMYLSIYIDIAVVVAGGEWLRHEVERNNARLWLRLVGVDVI